MSKRKFEAITEKKNYVPLDNEFAPRRLWISRSLAMELMDWTVMLDLYQRPFLAAISDATGIPEAVVKYGILSLFYTGGYVRMRMVENETDGGMVDMYALYLFGYRNQEMIQREVFNVYIK